MEICADCESEKVADIEVEELPEYDELNDQREVNEEIGVWEDDIVIIEKVGLTVEVNDCVGVLIKDSEDVPDCICVELFVNRGLFVELDNELVVSELVDVRDCVGVPVCVPVPVDVRDCVGVSEEFEVRVAVFVVVADPV